MSLLRDMALRGDVSGGKVIRVPLVGKRDYGLGFVNPDFMEKT